MQKQYLSHTKQIDQSCNNAVHKASVAIVGTYKLEIYVPADCGTTTAKSVIVQWQGRPIRLVYKDSAGSIQELSNPLALSSTLPL